MNITPRIHGAFRSIIFWAEEVFKFLENSVGSFKKCYPNAYSQIRGVIQSIAVSAIFFTILRLFFTAIYYLMATSIFSDSIEFFNKNNSISLGASNYIHYSKTLLMPVLIVSVSAGYFFYKITNKKINLILVIILLIFSVKFNLDFNRKWADYSYDSLQPNFIWIFFSVLIIYFLSFLSFGKYLSEYKLINKINIFKIINYVFLVLALFFLCQNYFGQFVLTKEALGQNFILNESQNEMTLKRLNNFNITNQNKFHVNTSAEVYKLIFDPKYSNKESNVSELIFYEHIDDEFIENKIAYFKEKIKKLSEYGGIISPVYDVENKSLKFRIDNYNKINICLLVIINYENNYGKYDHNNKENNLTTFNNQGFDLDGCIKSLSQKSGADLMREVSDLPLNQAAKKRLIKYLEVTESRIFLVNSLSESLGLKAIGSGALSAEIISRALGHKLHHTHNFTQSIYAYGNYGWLDGFKLQNQYGFGVENIAYFFSGFNKTPFDISIKAIALIDFLCLGFVITVFLLSVNIQYKKLLFNYLFFITSGLILLQLTGAYYAPGLHYIRILPQILMIMLCLYFYSSGDFRGRHLLTAIVSLSWIYNWEFGIFSILSYLIVSFLFYPNSIVSNISRHKDICAVIFSGLVALLSKFAFMKGAARSLEYMLGIGMGMTNFGLYNKLSLFIVLIFLIYYTLLYFKSNISKREILFYPFFILILSSFVLTKFQWTTSLAHLVITFPLIGSLFVMDLGRNYNFGVFKWKLNLKYDYIFYLGVILSFLLISTQLNQYIWDYKQNRALVRDLYFEREPILGGGVLVPEDLVKYKNDLLDLIEGRELTRLPIISYADSYASMVLKLRISSPFEDLATNLRSTKDLDLAIKHLRSNESCIVVDNAVLLDEVDRSRIFPNVGSINLLNGDVGSISRERDMLFELATILTKSSFSKIRAKNYSFTLFCKN